MLYYKRIDISKGVYPAESNNSNKCMICHYWFFSHGFQFQYSICNSCHDLTMLIVNIRVITIKSTHYHYIIHGIEKSKAINLLKDSAVDDRGYI